MRLKGGGRACHIIFLTKTRGSRHVQGLSPDLRTVEGDETPVRERNTIAQRGSAA
ncbi:hypothetical protein QE368_001507 [Asaia bogorensis NBRC 16594]|nr:hypothetical protein [Asaia bogorensis NBRC 16594]